MQNHNLNLPSLKEVQDLKGKKVLLRLSLNAPIEDGKVRNNFRLLSSVPTIKWLQEQGAKVVIIGHIGRSEKDTLLPVYESLSQLVSMKWMGGLFGDDISSNIETMQEGEVVMLENLRQDPREAANEDSMAEELAAYADIYINEAFAASHRNHSSIVGIPKHLPSYFGFQFIRECEELVKAIKPETPALFMLGGAKFDTKFPLVSKLADVYTKVFIGGALANDIYKARGYEIGVSLTSDIDLKNESLINNEKIIVPVDVTVTGKNGVRVTTPDQVQPHEKIVDAGPQTIKDLKDFLNEAKFVLWNGPLGYYEGNFNTYTEALAMEVAKAKAYSIIGGGDTVAAIENLALQDKINFVSTGGGAMLSFLEYGTLPAIEAVKN